MNFLGPGLTYKRAADGIMANTVKKQLKQKQWAHISPEWVSNIAAISFSPYQNQNFTIEEIFHLYYGIYGAPEICNFILKIPVCKMTFFKESCVPIFSCHTSNKPRSNGNCRESTCSVTEPSERNGSQQMANVTMTVDAIFANLKNLKYPMSAWKLHNIENLCEVQMVNTCNYPVFLWSLHFPSK